MIPQVGVWGGGSWSPGLRVQALELVALGLRAYGFGLPLKGSTGFRGLGLRAYGFWV